MPRLERILPTGVWERFAQPFRRACGLSLVAFDREGRAVSGQGNMERLCSATHAGDHARCTAFYRKVVQQAGQGDDALLFRCPQERMVFAAPVRVKGHGAPLLTILGGVGERGVSAKGERGTTSAPFGLGPRALLEFARLAQQSLLSAVQGRLAQEEYGRRQAQIMTLFDIATDLTEAASSHEVFALALNALGVLFEVEEAALLFPEPGAASYRVQTAMGGLENALRSWAFVPDAAVAARLETPSGTVRLDEAHVLGRMGLPESVENLSLFPVQGGGRRLGLLALVNADLSSEESQLVRGFACQLALTLENRRLREELAGKQVEFRSVQETSRRFLECLQPDQLFPAILEEARKITGAQKGSLMIPVNGNGELVVKSVVGLQERVADKLRVRSGRGISGRVYATGEAILVADLERDGRFRRRNRPRYTTRSFVSVPISLEGRIMGVLNLADKLSGDVFSEEDLRLLQAMTSQATIAIERSTYYAQSLELKKISITDGLTGLLNRRYFQERLAEEVDRATRHGHPLALIMIDIDHFKAYNDANGHPAGDKALVLVGRALRANVRTIDVVSRFGGEEFAVILPETRRQGAAEIGERIRREIESLYFAGEEALPGGRVTVSLGVAGFPEDSRDMKSLIQKADRALYHAKAQGRNRLVCYAVPELPPSRDPPSAWTKVL